MTTRDSKGRFSFIGKWFKRGLWLLALAMGVAVAVDYYYLTPENMSYSASPVIGVKEVLAEAKGATYEEKIANVKSKIVDDLATKCETKDRKDPDGTIIFDSNEVPSVGSWQWQPPEVIRYVKKWEGREIKKAEAIIIAVTHDKAQALTEQTLFEEEAVWNEKTKRWEGGWANWYNCSKKLGLDEKIAIIKEIENI